MGRGGLGLGLGLELVSEVMFWAFSEYPFSASQLYCTYMISVQVHVVWYTEANIAPVSCEKVLEQSRGTLRELAAGRADPNCSRNGKQPEGTAAAAGLPCRLAHLVVLQLYFLLRTASTYVTQR